MAYGSCSKGGSYEAYRGVETGPWYCVKCGIAFNDFKSIVYGGCSVGERTFFTKGRNQDLGTASNAGCHSRILNHSFTAVAVAAENMRFYKTHIVT